jgi:hypothetical protein
MSDTIGALADEYWDVWMESTPVLATIYGDHRFDDRLGPVLPEDVDVFAARARRIADRAAALDGLDRAAALTRDILVVTARSAADLAATGLYTAPISPYLGVQSALPNALSRTAAAEPSHAEMLLERIRSIPAYLADVEERHRIDLAAGITPTLVNLERVLGQIDSSLAAPIETDPMLAIGAPPDWPGEEQWRSDLRHAVEEGVRPALARYREFLAETATPVARPDDRAGILHLPDGEQRYALLVSVFTSLHAAPDAIHEIGVAEATGVLRDEFAAIGSEAFGLDDPAAVIDRLRSDPALRYDNEEEMLEHARRTIERAWQAVPPWFGRMPRNPCEVVPVPAGFAPSMPPAYYGVGAPDGSRPGRYYLNTHQPRTRTRFDAEADRPSRGDTRPPLRPHAGIRTDRHPAVPQLCGRHRPRRRVGTVRRAPGRRDRAVFDTRRPAGHGQFRRLAGDSGSSSTPASITWVGRDARRSSSSPPTHRSRRRRSRSKSTATSPCPARPWPTRWDSGRSSDCEKGQRGDGRAVLVSGIPRCRARQRIGAPGGARQARRRLDLRCPRLPE